VKQGLKAMMETCGAGLGCKKNIHISEAHAPCQASS
jgi:hypothetical protein